MGPALAAAALFAAAPAGAHDNWLEIEPPASAAPAKAKVYLLSGEHFTEAQPLRPRTRDRYTSLRVVSAAGRRDVTAEIREDQEPLATPGLGAAAGSFVIALDASPRVIQIGAKHFNEYLLEERLVDVLLLRALAGAEDEAGRERYTRNLKAIVQIGSRLDPVVTQPVGADLEVVPLAHPHGVAPGGALTVQVLFKGKPLAGRAIMAANRFRSDVGTKTVRTDANGKATFTLGRAGDWMFRMVHMERSSEPDVDWRSYWTSLTFTLPEKANAAAAARAP